MLPYAGQNVSHRDTNERASIRQMIAFGGGPRAPKWRNDTRSGMG